MDNFFTQTSDVSYDRHHYKIKYSNNSEKIVDNYYDVNYEWASGNAILVDVLDKKRKKSSGGGFK